MWRYVLTCATALVVASAAIAQRPDSPRIPQPVSVAEVQRWGEILELSEGQYLAVEAAYDDYLDEFDPLRREMIEAAVAHPQFWGGSEQFTAMLPAFVTRVQGLDESLFTRIDAILADPQRERLQRVRDLRTRTLLSRINALAWFIGDSLPELREMLEALDPPPETLAALEPALAEHERKATIAMRAIFDATLRLCGSTPPDDAAKDKLIEGVRAFRAMNRKLVDDLAPSMPEDIRRLWRGEFLLRAYGSAAEAGEVYALRRIEAALATDLTDAERAALEPLRDQAQKIETETMTMLLDVHDRDAIRHAPVGGARDTTGYLDTVNATRRDVSVKSSELSKKVTAILGDERVKALKIAPRLPLHSSGGLRSLCGVTANVGNVMRYGETRSVPHSRSDPLIPVPITTDDIEAIAAFLRFDESQRAAALERLHLHTASLEEPLKPLRDARNRANIPVPPAPGKEPADPRAVARASDEPRAKMRDIIDAATAQLLEDLRAIAGVEVDDPAWQRIVRLHERAALTLDLVLRPADDPNLSGDGDLVRMLLPRGLDREQWHAIEALVEAYEKERATLVTALFEDFRKHAIDEVARRNGWRGDGNSDYEAWSTQSARLHLQYRALAELNRTTLERLISALPAEAAAALRSEFEQAAYPRAFDDPASMEAALTKAAALDGLSADQRAALADLRATFDADSSAVRRDMVDVCAVVKPDLPMIGRTGNAERQTMEERFKLEFDRLSDERAQVNRRGLRGLRLILTPEQLQRVQATPE